MTNKGSVTRVFLTSLVVILSILILAPIGLVVLIDPNDYKQDIQNYVQSRSDYELDIKGKITLSWYPWLGLDIQDLALKPKSTSSKQAQLLTAQQINLKIPVQRLLKQEFQLEAISLNGAIINIEVDSKGNLNWPSEPHEKKTSSSTSHSSPPQTSAEAETQKNNLLLPVDTLKIQNSRIRYTDKVSGIETLLDNVDLDINNISPNAKVTPIKTSCDFKITELKNKKLRHSGHSELSTLLKNQGANWLLDKTHSEFTWQDVKQKQSHHITADTTITIQPNKEIAITNFVAMIDQTPAQGQMTIPLSQPHKSPILFNLNMDKLTIDPWLAMLASNDEPQFTKTAQTTPKQPNTPNAKGKITVQQLQYRNLRAQKVNLNIDIQNNRLTINPLTASLYQGNLKAQVAKNMTDASPTYIKGQLNTVNMQALLNDAAGTKQLQGIGDIVFELTQSPQSTRGRSHVTIKQGVVQGLDLDYYYDVANSLLNKTPKPSQNANGQTQFNQLTATLHLNDHVLDNPDLLVLGDDYKITGKGGLNLQQSLIKYDIMAIRLNDSDRIKNQLPLAVQIRGPLTHPTVTPDLNKYAQMLLEKEGQKLINKEINKLIGADKNVDGDENAEVQNKIEEEISKGLKKLFKF
tara:strand:+ start:23435 stop:25336 length:1902 start_codon:yes stop_codon:yes gene_type:complete